MACSRPWSSWTGSRRRTGSWNRISDAGRSAVRSSSFARGADPAGRGPAFPRRPIAADRRRSFARPAPGAAASRLSFVPTLSPLNPTALT
ncbi:hypothetical protein [Lysobacter gummosus]|uniref:hypothetical protein n=1 Tax=Lysobacter gummosus TaxID=262324 RepID=UPI00364411AD